MDLKILANKELDGLANHQDLQTLNEDLSGWNEALGAIYRDVTEQIVEAKTFYLSRGLTAPGRIEFQKIKGELVARMNLIVAKKKLVKELLRDEREEDPTKDTHGQMLNRIWAEIRTIRELLEKANVQ